MNATIFIVRLLYDIMRHAILSYLLKILKIFGYYKTENIVM